MTNNSNVVVMAPSPQRYIAVKFARIWILTQIFTSSFPVYGFQSVRLRKDLLNRLALSVKKTSAPIQSGTTRQKNVQSLLDWAERSNIQVAKSFLTIRHEENSGLGLYSQGNNIPSGSVILSVPTKLALSVEAPGDGPNNRAVVDEFGKQITDLPWFVQMSLYLNTLKRKQQQQDQDYTAWLDSLPKSFETPFHWNDATRNELQYNFLIDSVTRQEASWKQLFDTISTSSKSLSFPEFVWGCECARSRAFSGSYTGSAFNPTIYAFVLLLITIYVGLDIGTLEQAANGAGVVVSVSILKGMCILSADFCCCNHEMCTLIY
jgi:hypothetical protein